ncbi:hypothetical protein [Chitinophaga sp.]|uniref:hypothetical protein n=1 Tax=Chitinophaga sp. TaxID=1869181 RepID=UPI002BB2345F|nr:hypothetical protein [Chitinophaga sp.]HWV69519.1 hypothetical protein [Chitinophaga sp.]
MATIVQPVPYLVTNDNVNMVYFVCRLILALMQPQTILSSQLLLEIAKEGQQPALLPNEILSPCDDYADRLLQVFHGKIVCACL